MGTAKQRRPAWVLLSIFAAALGLSLFIAGSKVAQPSPHPHYAYMARGWLDGRLQLEGQPPGYCNTQRRRRGECKRHRHNDWAVVWDLTLADGSEVRGMPCRSAACTQSREPGVEAWVDMQGEVHKIARRDIRERHDQWFVSFPPGPAVFMLPWVAVAGLGVWDVLLTCIVAALAPLVIVMGLDRRFGLARHHLWIAAAWAAASPALFVGAHGSVWFTAQSLGALFALAYVFDAGDTERPFRAGLWLALAMSCRPHAAFGVLYFAWQWSRGGRSPRAAMRFAAPLLVVGVAMATHNYLRFESIFEFGHRYLDVRWQGRMQTLGQFSFRYLPRNLECLLWLWPQGRAEFPGFAVSMHGSALWFMSPWLFALGGAGAALKARPALWLSALLVALPPLAYHNSGQLQLSYRFALDWLPYLVPLVAASRWSRGRAFPLAVVFGAALSVSSAYAFAREPARIFVTNPVGWPFEAELQR